ncbi:GxxExxY protein [Methanocella paludicola]|uniref:GxxExxY protein n=1 Tax=Methanocella paludicola TaxID=570267 RepID=UPI000FFB419D|nr:GxxExxY protein [Methanocella paludicola]
MSNVLTRDPIPNEINKITGQIVDAAFVVHTTFGPGLLESIYEECLIHELKLRGIKVESQINVPLDFKGLYIERGLILDVLVEGQVIVEVKSVKELHPVYEQQLLTYMKITGKRVGLLINFNAPLIKNGIKRMVL